MNKRSEINQRYMDKAIRRFTLKLNRFTEPELLDWLESQDNKQGYIKELILADMAKKGERGQE